MPLHALRRLALVASFLLLAACVEPGTHTSSSDLPPLRSASSFQAELDALGIPLRLPPGRAILVNIPAYELVAFEDGVPVLRSRVIIGTPRDRTPRIDTYTSRVTFRPSWRPTPLMIARGEARDGVRPPGEDNPLGLAAVWLGPGLQIYLHDTSHRHLFGRQMRALSHGCIRVERWDELIAWILGQDVDWVRTMAGTPPSREVPAPHVPVLIRYLPLFPAADGRVLRHPDIYRLGTR
ncbi:MAG: L,D-transpeptidase family protein [Paracoccaceae bacterium]|nr:L,D-transpeptidase family protein [Paracoccaceae bacterium]